MGCSRNRKNDKRDDQVAGASRSKCRRNDNVRFNADIEIDRDEFCREYVVVYVMTMSLVLKRKITIMTDDVKDADSNLITQIKKRNHPKKSERQNDCLSDFFRMIDTVSISSYYL